MTRPTWPPARRQTVCWPRGPTLYVLAAVLAPLWLGAGVAGDGLSLAAWLGDFPGGLGVLAVLGLATSSDDGIDGLVEKLHRLRDGEDVEFRTDRTDELADLSVALDGVAEELTACRAERASADERNRDENRIIERYRPLIESAGDPMAVLDAEGRFEVVNEAMVTFHGTDREALLGTDARTLVADAGADAIEDAQRALLSDPDRRWEQVEVSLANADGEKRRYEANVGVLRDDDGAFDGSVLTFRDVTERVEATAALRERERELAEQRAFAEDILDAVDDVFYVLDRDGTVLRWNRSLVAATGYSDAEIEQMHALDFFDDEDRETIASAIETAFETGEVRVEAHYLTKDGERVPYEFVASRLEDPEGEPVLTGIGRDITERTARERERRETNERLNAIVEASPDALIALDRDDRITLWNPAAERMFGWCEDEVLGEPLPTASGDSTAEHRELFERVMDGEIVTGIETIRQTKDGDQIDVSLSIAPIRDADGSIVGTMGALQDITERKEYERELERTTALLSRAEEMADVGGWSVVVSDGRPHSPEWSDKLYDIFELPRDEEPPSEEVFKYYHPDDRDRHRRAVERAVEDGERWDQELRLVTAEGTERWVRNIGEPVVEDGETVEIRGSIQDVSESREREEELRETKDRLAEHNRTLRQLFELSADPELSFEEKVVQMLELGRERLGTSGAFVSSIDEEHDRFEFTHASGTIDAIEPGIVAPYSETYCQHLVGGEEIFEVLDARSGDVIDDVSYDRWGLDTYFGTSVFVEGTLVGTLAFVDQSPPDQPLNDAQRTFLSLAGQWVSFELDRQRRERYLEEYKEYTDDILDAIDDVFYVMDDEGTFLRWNETFTAVTGYDEAEIIAMNALEFFPADVHDRILEGLEAVFEGPGSRRVEAPIRTKDGEEIPYEFVASTVENPDGVTELVGMGRDVTERQRREAQLERASELLEQAQRIAGVGGWEYEVETESLTVTDEFRRLHGIEPDAPVALEEVVERYHEDDVEYIQETFQAAIEKGRDYDMEVRLHHPDDGDRWIRSLAHPVQDDGETVKLRGSVQDITEAKEREEAIRTLHDTAQGLLQTETAAEVADLVVGTAADVLEVSGVCLYRLDEGTNQLVAAACTPEYEAVTGGAPPIAVGAEDDVIWNSFATGNRRVFDDSEEVGRSGPFSDAVGGWLVVPIGGHGVLVVTTAQPGVPVRTRQLVETLVATTEAAFDRLASEASLRERDAELEARNRRLRRQIQLTDVIRRVDRSLVGANSHEEIETAVCEQLAAAEDIAFAWIGSVGADDELAPRTWAGSGETYLDGVDLTLAATGTDPSVRTARSGEPAVVSNVLADVANEGWRKSALDSGFRSALAVPIAFEDYRHGVLTVYANEADAFGDLERTVFAELGQTIANAINAVKTREALHADTLLELQLRLEAPDTFLAQVARRADGEVEYVGIGSQSDDETNVFFATEGETDVESALDGLVAVSEHRLLSEREGRRVFEAAVTGPVLPAKLIRHGAQPTSIRATPADVAVTVSVPTSTDVREFVEMLEESYPAVELAGRRNVTRATRTRQEMVSDLLEGLTDRQLEVLRTAFYAGYFDWPRGSSGEEIAEMLGVTQPTVSRHLRLGQHELLSRLLAEEPTTLAPS